MRSDVEPDTASSEASALEHEESVSESSGKQWRHYPVRKTTLREQDEDPDLENTTAAERIGMMWQLTVDAWAFAGRPVADAPLQRHRVRVRRRRC